MRTQKSRFQQRNKNKSKFVKKRKENNKNSGFKIVYSKKNKKLKNYKQRNFSPDESESVSDSEDSQSFDSTHIITNNISFNPTRNKNNNLLTPPWIGERTKESVGIIKLHYEILDFYEFIKSKDEEDRKRMETIKLLKQLINNKWPHWKLKVFGSFPNALHLPNSDIDVVILKQDSVSLKDFFNYAQDSILSDTQMLNLIYRELLTKTFVKEIRYVDAKVPIIKAKCKATGINIDVS
jgi:poly(A) polymerase Pap1